MLTFPTSGHMPFQNQHGTVITVTNGSVGHKFGVSVANVVRWSPVIDGMAVPGLENFSVVCNPVLSGSWLSFTACECRQDEPAIYHLYKLKDGRVRRVLQKPVYSGFVNESGLSYTIGGGSAFVHLSTEFFVDRDYHIVRIVPCHDQTVGGSDAVLLTLLLDGFTGPEPYRTVLFRPHDLTTWDIRLTDGSNVYKSTIYDGHLLHVTKHGDGEASRVIRRVSLADVRLTQASPETTIRNGNQTR